MMNRNDCKQWVLERLGSRDRKVYPWLFPSNYEEKYTEHEFITDLCLSLIQGESQEEFLKKLNDDNVSFVKPFVKHFLLHNIPWNSFIKEIERSTADENKVDAICRLINEKLTRAERFRIIDEKQIRIDQFRFSDYYTAYIIFCNNTNHSLELKISFCENLFTYFKNQFKKELRPDKIKYMDLPVYIKAPLAKTPEEEKTFFFYTFFTQRLSLLSWKEFYAKSHEWDINGKNPLDEEKQYKSAATALYSSSTPEEKRNEQEEQEELLKKIKGQYEMAFFDFCYPLHLKKTQEECLKSFTTLDDKIFIEHLVLYNIPTFAEEIKKIKNNIEENRLAKRNAISEQVLRDLDDQVADINLAIETFAKSPEDKEGFKKLIKKEQDSTQDKINAQLDNAELDRLIQQAILLIDQKLTEVGNCNLFDYYFAYATLCLDKNLSQEEKILFCHALPALAQKAAAKKQNIFKPGTGAVNWDMFKRLCEDLEVKAGIITDTKFVEALALMKEPNSLDPKAAVANVFRSKFTEDSGRAFKTALIRARDNILTLLEDQKLTSNEAHNIAKLVYDFTQLVANCTVKSHHCKAFHQAIEPYTKVQVLTKILGTLIGAALGVLLGVTVTMLVTNPLSLIFSLIIISIGGTVGASMGMMWCSMWRPTKNHPLTLLKKAGEEVVNTLPIANATPQYELSYIQQLKS